MTKLSTLFSIPSPEDGDAPDGPTQLKAQSDLIDTLLDRAGAQSKKFILNAEGSRAINSFGSLGGGPDRVTGLVVPTDGIIRVLYSGFIYGSDLAEAALFLNENQLKAIQSTGAPTVQGVKIPGGSALGGGEGFRLLSTAGGLVLAAKGAGLTNVSGQTAGMAGSGVLDIEVDAGTYEVSIRYKAPFAGSVGGAQRRLRAWVKRFV